MTDQQRIEALETWRADMHREMRLEKACGQLALILMSLPEGDIPRVAELMQGWLEYVSAGMPDASIWGNLRSDAGFWADIATTAEIEAYVGAGLRRIERATFAESARKRIFVDLWEQMSNADRHAFMSRVDPEGNFQRGAA